MRTILFILVALLLSASNTAGADALSYSYLEAAYGNQSRDAFPGDKSADLSMSLVVTDHTFLSLRFAHDDFGAYRGEPARDGLVRESQTLLAGVHLPLADNADAVLRLGYQGTDTSEQGRRARKHSGAAFGAGVRWSLSPPLEVYAFYDRDQGEFDPSGLGATFGHLDPGIWENVLSTGVRWHLGAGFALGATFEYSHPANGKRSMITLGWFF